MVEYLDWN